MPQPQTCFRLQNQYADRETGLHIWFQQKIRISKRMWVQPKALLAL